MEAIWVILLIILALAVLYLFYKSTLHWLWDLGLFLAVIALAIALNRQAIQNPFVWDVLAAVLIGYIALVLLVGSVESVFNVGRLQKIQNTLDHMAKANPSLLVFPAPPSSPVPSGRGGGTTGGVSSGGESSHGGMPAHSPSPATVPGHSR